MGKLLLIGAGAVALLAAAYFVVTPMLRPAPKAVEAPPAKAEVPAPKASPMPVEPEPAPAPEPKAIRPRPKKEKPPEPVAPAPAPAGPVVIVESDVAGASVFVDREYLGTTPLRVTTLKPGRHQLNASAEGEDGIVQSIEVADTGDTTIALRFREVRLDASLPVIHKHGVGSCEGTLRGTPAGLRYDSTNKKDAFAMPFKDLEVFEIDYLKKELKVKQRGGKTWNFTDRHDNADKLFIFHRDVSKAREKLAAQAK
jgi:hypothetical protein